MLTLLVSTFGSRQLTQLLRTLQSHARTTTESVRLHMKRGRTQLTCYLQICVGFSQLVQAVPSFLTRKVTLSNCQLAIETAA